MVRCIVKGKICVYHVKTFVQITDIFENIHNLALVTMFACLEHTGESVHKVTEEKDKMIAVGIKCLDGACAIVSAGSQMFVCELPNRYDGH